MSDFWIYVEIGLKHVLNLKGYDHVLFLMALTALHTFKDWKKILILVKDFEIGMKHLCIKIIVCNRIN